MLIGACIRYYDQFTPAGIRTYFTKRFNYTSTRYPKFKDVVRGEKTLDKQVIDESCRHRSALSNTMPPPPPQFPGISLVLFFFWRYRTEFLALAFGIWVTPTFRHRSRRLGSPGTSSASSPSFRCWTGRRRHSWLRHYLDPFSPVSRRYTALHTPHDIPFFSCTRAAC